MSDFPRSPKSLNRRRFLFAVTSAPLCSPFAAATLGAFQRREILRAMDFSEMGSLLTPNFEFFIRDHFHLPLLSASKWKLQLTGHLRSPLEISYEELVRLPQRTMTATLECAGNAVGQGAVSTATWTGVSLATLLKGAGLRPGVKQIRFIGADHGAETPSKLPVSFARSIPLEKALDFDTLVAFRMNGSSLPKEHGYPVRVIVPGWYATDSVKWLIRIEALDHPDESYFMTQRYVAIRLETIGTNQYPVTRMQVKSQMTKPQEGAILPRGSYTIRGAAWAGENRVARVDVSTDAGERWSPAVLHSDRRRYTWVLWSYGWNIQKPGSYILMSRATDDHGNIQPIVRDSLRYDGYELNSCQSVPCEVR